jgi:hypothetical protein
MAIAKGTSKVVAYKKETAWGTLAGAASGKQLRRVTAAFDLTKETYESNEIRTDRQVADLRHGTRSATGSVNGELSPKTYADFMQSIVARDFTAVSATAPATFTTAGTAPTFTITRATGDWIASGYQPGHVIRITAGTGANANNLNKNLLITSATALVLTVVVLNGSAFTGSSITAAGAISVIGKTTFVPTTGHTEDSYTIEEWFGDIAQSETYSGMKPGTMNVQLPATGLSTIDISFMGKDLASKGTSQYFTSPTVLGTEGLFAAVNGALVVGGTTAALVTSADFSVERAMENAVAVGSNNIADIFTGRIRVTGNLSVYFQDASLRDLFDNETPVSLVLALTSDNTNTSNFISFTIPKIKLGSFTSDDGELGLTSQSSFVALLNDVTSGGLPATTISIQDSAI